MDKHMQAAYEGVRMEHGPECDCARCEDGLADALVEVARKRLNAEVLTNAVEAADLLAGLPDDPLGQCVQLVLTGDYIMAGEKLQRLLLTEIGKRAQKNSQNLSRFDLPN